MTVFGGLLTATASLPKPLRWLRHTSLFYFGFEALVANELGGGGGQDASYGIDIGAMKGAQAAHHTPRCRSRARLCPPR